MQSKLMSKELLDARIAIHNATANETIRERLSRYAYTPERMKEGQRLFETANNLFQVHLDGKKDQMQAWDDLMDIWKEGTKEYNRYRALSKVALRGQDAHLKSLALGPRTRNTLSGWLDQARIFYTNSLANNEILTAFANVGVSKEDLEKAAEQVTEVETAQAKHKRAKASAHQDIKKRNKAFDDLRAWMKDFWAICRVALADKMELMTSLKLRK